MNLRFAFVVSSAILLCHTPIFAVNQAAFPQLDQHQDQKIYIAKDYKRNLSISLQNSKGHTIVTNMDTGERIVERGEFAHTLTDAGYTEMMDKKERKMEEGKQEAQRQEVPQPDASFSSNSGRFAITGSIYPSGGGFNTPLYYLNGSNGAKVAITNAMSGAHLNDYHTNYVEVTLYRNVDFFPDTNLGTNTFWVNSRYATSVTFSWPNVTPGSYYYINFDKKYENEYTSWGDFTLTN